MTDDKKALAKTDSALKAWGERDSVAALGRRVKTLMPGGDKLTDNQAIAVAQAASVMDANFLRGEVYGYPDKNGKLVLVEGYKLLIRWAKRISEYAEKYRRLEAGERNTAPDDICYEIKLIRDDRKPKIREWMEMGASFQEAFDMEATAAYGTVSKAETWNSYKKKPIPAPKGWTWDDVARKRALKNAINQAYGMPSPKEMAQMSWEVEGTQTQPEDWENSEKYDQQWQREEAAKLEANQREWQSDWDKMSRERQRQTAADNIELMRGDDSDPVEDVPFREVEQPAFDDDFGDDAAELEPVEVEAIVEAVEGVQDSVRRSKPMSREAFNAEIKTRNANRTEAHLATEIRKMLNADWNYYQSDNQVREAIRAATGQIPVWPPKTADKAYEGYKLAWEHCQGLDATK